MQFIWTVLWVWQLLLKTNFLILEFKSVASLSGLKGRLNSNEEVSCIIFLLLKFLLLKLMNPAQTLPLSHCYTFILCTSASFLAMTTVKCYAAFRNIQQTCGPIIEFLFIYFPCVSVTDRKSSYIKRTQYLTREIHLKVKWLNKYKKRKKIIRLDKSFPPTKIFMPWWSSNPLEFVDVKLFCRKAECRTMKFLRLFALIPW